MNIGMHSFKNQLTKLHYTIRLQELWRKIPTIWFVGLVLDTPIYILNSLKRAGSAK